MEASLASHFAFLSTCLCHTVIFWGQQKCSSWRTCRKSWRMLQRVGLSPTSHHHSSATLGFKWIHFLFVSIFLLAFSWFGCAVCVTGMFARSHHCILFPWTKLLEGLGISWRGGREKWFASAGGLLSNKRSTKMPEWITAFLWQQSITGEMFF